MSASFRKPLAEKCDTITLTDIIRPYGVGIDTHSKFIAVCVLIKKDGDVVRFEKNFPTAWASMLAARDWVLSKLASVLPHLLEYCIESTGCYHMPVLQAFGGVPSVVNPMLAGATHRKTDKLDARMLAQQAMTGMWRSVVSCAPGSAGFACLVGGADGSQPMLHADVQPGEQHIVALRPHLWR